MWFTRQTEGIMFILEEKIYLGNLVTFCLSLNGNVGISFAGNEAIYLHNAPNKGYKFTKRDGVRIGPALLKRISVHANVLVRLGNSRICRIIPGHAAVKRTCVQKSLRAKV